VDFLTSNKRGADGKEWLGKVLKAEGTDSAEESTPELDYEIQQREEKRGMVVE